MMNPAKIGRRSTRLALLVTTMMFAGCDQAITSMSGEMIKQGMVETCGEDDQPCLQAVENQFGACQQKYQVQWNAYMNAPTEKEDELLDTYMNNMYDCIVDEKGEPYFFLPKDMTPPA